MTDVFPELDLSYPVVNPSNLDAAKRAFFDGLPEDYRGFLLARNGGIADPFRYTFLTGVPFQTDLIDNPSGNDCAVDFFGLSETPTPAPEKGPTDLFEAVENHKAEKFLPRAVIAIARCAQNSLVCISLRPVDLGAIYYWDREWRAPWCEAFFEDRIEQEKRRFGDIDAILADSSHPQFHAAFDALNFATLVPLANDFREWSRSCTDQR